MAQVSPDDRRDIAGIQYLRGLAAIMVVAFHLSYQLSRMYPLAELSNLASGVDVFFVISGFVMMHSTRGGASLSPGRFLLHRLARVAPLYWAATLATIAALLLLPGLVRTARFSVVHAALSLLFVAAPNPVGGLVAPLVVVGWTLNLEMFFYVVFAGAIALGRRSPQRVVAGVLGVLGVLALAGLAVRPTGVTGFYVNPILLEFAMGIALAWIYRLRPRPWPPRTAWLGVGLGVGALLVLLLPGQGDLMLRPFRYGLPAATLVAAATWTDLPRWRAMHRLGDISYSLYLCHFFTNSAVAQIWRRTGAGDGIGALAIFYAAGAACACIVAYLCWRWVERPLTALARRLMHARKRSDRPRVAIF